jgi:hypothetical protein
MNKRTWVVGLCVLAVAFLLGLGACGGEEADENTGVSEIGAEPTVSDDEIGRTEQSASSRRTVSCVLWYSFHYGAWMWHCCYVDGTCCDFYYSGPPDPVYCSDW